MKNLLIPVKYGTYFLILALLMLGCGGSASTNSTGGSSGDGVVQFKMDGVDWISGPPGHPELKYEEEATTDGNTMVRIEAFAADGSHFALTIYRASNVGPGTYPISESGMLGFFKDDFNEGGGYLTGGIRDSPGQITISSMTEDKVAGTFAFPIRSSGDPEDIRQITEGSFEVPFTYY